MAVAAGIFLYLGAGDFLPHADEELSTRKTALAMFIGVFIMMITINSIPHAHEHNDADNHEQQAIEQSFDNQ